MLPTLRLPLLKPGKSLRFALLPEGQDPDDLARTGGRGAIEEVIGGRARPLADMIWSREIEGGNFATPERRAALEARIGELANSVRDDVVRRYYREDLIQRLQRTFAPEPVRFPPRGNFRESPRFQPRAAAAPANSRSAASRPAAGLRPRPLSGDQPAARQQPDHARPALDLLPPRGADPAMPDQSPLAAA